MSPLRLPCWWLLTLARLMVVAAAIGAALVLLALAPAGRPCPAASHSRRSVEGHPTPADRSGSRPGRAAPISRQPPRGNDPPVRGEPAAPRVGDPTRSRDPKSDRGGGELQGLPEDSTGPCSARVQNYHEFAQ
jgi:hypothetical protein